MNGKPHPKMSFVASLENYPPFPTPPKTQSNQGCVAFRVALCSITVSNHRLNKADLAGHIQADDKGEVRANQKQIGDCLPFLSVAGRCGTDFPREWGLMELPRSFLKSPWILFLVLQGIFFLCGKCQCLSFKSQKKKEREKEDLQKQAPCCPFAHSCRERSQELLMNVPAVCGKSAKLRLWAFISLLRSLC